MNLLELTGLLYQGIFRVIRRLKPIGLAVFLTLCSTGPGQALELGLTPSHVYGLWLNINSVFYEIQRQSTPQDDLLNNINAVRPVTFKDKKPANVFVRARAIQARLIKLYGLSPPPPPPSWIEDYQVLEGKTVGGEITPSQVFLLSTQILNALVEKYVDLTDGGLPVSQFYRDKQISGKVPSDVFGLVDLLGRRLELIDKYQKPTPTSGKKEQ